jgi:hypothetical protein
MEVRWVEAFKSGEEIRQEAKRQLAEMTGDYSNLYDKDYRIPVGLGNWAVLCIRCFSFVLEQYSDRHQRWHNELSDQGTV